jgi:hypothetical protein
MSMDAVIGCDAVVVDPQWLRLKTATGALRTIPWTTVRIAGMGGNHDGHMKIQGVTEKVTPLFATHDSLWIVSGDGSLAQAMLEKTHANRESILAMFAQQLGDRWHGDQLSVNQLSEEMMRMPALAPIRLPKTLIVMMIVMGASVLLAIVVLMFVHPK